MHSAFEDPGFSSFWDQISGKYGQPYKRYVLDPIMFKQMGSLRGKIVLDLGCGNGYLGPKFLKAGAKHVLLMDISELNLRYAKLLNRSHSGHVTFIRQDATNRWKVKPPVNIVFSDMMLNELKNIKMPVREAYRVLSKGGVFVAAVTHPSWDLYEYVQDTAGRPRNIMKGARSYFFRGHTRFIMGAHSLMPPPGQEYPECFEIEHYQRPLEDYFGAFSDAGFRVDRLLEPAMPQSFLRRYPGYEEMKAHPVSLVFVARK